MVQRWAMGCVAAALLSGLARADTTPTSEPESFATLAAATPTFVPPPAVYPSAGFARTPPGLMSAPPSTMVAEAPTSCDPINRVRCAPCGPQERVWVSADYLLWAVKSNGTPPLVALDPAGTARSAVGIPSTPGQQILFGGSPLNGDMRSGLRINGGVWLDEQRLWAVSGDFFFLATGTDGGTFSSPGNPPLSRPFFNVATGLSDAELVAFPGVVSGSVAVSTHNTFNGAGVYLQRNLCCNFDPCNDFGYRVDLLAGYRYFGLNDDLSVRENLLSSGQMGVPPGTQLIVSDHFRTENTFNGGLLGLAGNVQLGKWSLGFRGGASLGNLHRELTIDGSTIITAPGQPPDGRVGGLLAQRSNIGHYTSDTFTVVPEVGVNLGYQLTQNVRVQVGYTFLYAPNVWRAGDQIDRGIDPAQLRGGTGALGRPVPTFASTGAFVQGVNMGLTFRY